MKKILGLDLGVSSIGWALIHENDQEGAEEILGMGVRIVPLTTDEKDEFSKGNKISKNQKRTLTRSQRRGLDRYQQRRAKLIRLLERENMMPPPEMAKLSPLELYGLRARAVTQEVSREELGRILLHLNQRRGYKSTKAEESESAAKKKADPEKDYLTAVSNRHARIKELGLTIGQFFYQQLQEDPAYTIKNQVFPRKAYLEEFEAIVGRQQLPKNLVQEIRDEVIYFQRPLKSKKNLVKVCEFAGVCKIQKDGTEKWFGPKVAPVSSPMAQETRIWETINNLKPKNIANEDLKLTPEQRQQLYQVFHQKEAIKKKDMAKILGIREDQLKTDKLLEVGIKANIPFLQIAKIVGEQYPHLLRFDLQTNTLEKGTAFYVAKKTGEVTVQEDSLEISPTFEHEPYYQLWHTIYSIPDLEACRAALIKRFDIDEQTADQLARLDLTKYGFSNRSVKAMRKILPYLMMGHKYDVACALAGYNHSDSITTDENNSRQLLDFLPLLPKNSLRQPVVEKILNQLIHVVNSIYKTYGRPDVIRIELARELRQSQDERSKTAKAMNRIKSENEKIHKELESYGIRASRNNIIKYRLFQEISGDTTRTNATCIYCGKMFGFTDAMRGAEVDVEHIIPQQLRFDDSQSNKTLAHRLCNLEKNNMTAFDYMSTKSPAALQAYKERVEDFFKRKIISKTKHDNLLKTGAMLEKDGFIERQLQETRYISKKSLQLLRRACRDVVVTSGKITEYQRRLWGWNDVLMELQLPAYREHNFSKTIQVQGPDGHTFEKEIIPEWDKRKDHRHHAIDALVVACTRQGTIQFINKLHDKEVRDSMYDEISGQRTLQGKILERYIVKHRPFNTSQVAEAAAGILISIKPGKKVATKSRYSSEEKMRGLNREKGVLTPRGPLSEESVYGKIKVLESQKPVKYLFENPGLIMKPYIRELVESRLAEFDRDASKAIKSLKKDPIYLDAEKTIVLEHGSCYKEEYVIRYPLNNVSHKDLPSIIDPVVREALRNRFEQFDNDDKKAIQGLDENPIWYNEEKRIPIKRVRMLTGLSAVEPIRSNEQGEPMGFVKPGNNHHMAFYRDEAGNLQPHICSFWHAVERKKYGLPVIIEDPALIWSDVLQNANNHPDTFLAKLPKDGWQYNFSLQQNEMFVLGLGKEALEECLASNDYKTLSKHLYRVQKLGLYGKNIDIWFRHHLETELNDSESNKILKKYIPVKSISKLTDHNPIKVRLNHLGQLYLS